MYRDLPMIRLESDSEVDDEEIVRVSTRSQPGNDRDANALARSHVSLMDPSTKSVSPFTLSIQCPWSRYEVTAPCQSPPVIMIGSTPQATVRQSRCSCHRS